MKTYIELNKLANITDTDRLDFLIRSGTYVMAFKDSNKSTKFGLIKYEPKLPVIQLVTDLRPKDCIDYAMKNWRHF